MIGPLTSDDRCISIPIVVALAQLDSCGVFGIGGAGIWNYNNTFKPLQVMHNRMRNTYDWGIWWKAEPLYQYALRPKTLNLTTQSNVVVFCW